MVYHGKQPPKPPASAISNMQWGTDNEINALATLVGKYLPVYHPEVIYKEDG